MPAAEELGQADTMAARAGVGSLAAFVHGGIALLLLSGLYNYLGPDASGSPGGRPVPHAGRHQDVLALVLFFLASGLVGRSPALKGFP
ncbi:MAG: hypothetical protein Ct9H300mP1_37690 [Planctomycetaceae bacterium]|nr:MAG: hypothetical protein Ct9H300mP1_37690 [Planctomycetaceae bacterium]